MQVPERPVESTRHACWLDKWHLNPGVNQEYDFIDGLRGIAILMVLGAHFMYVNPSAGMATQFLGQLFGAGGTGIQLFFALSGFLISWPFWKRKFNRSDETVPRGYARRRCWKIYPPLALSVIVFTPIYIFLQNDWSYIAIAGQWLAGVPLLIPVSGKLNPVMWTLVIEAQFYLVLPLIFLGFKKLSPRTCLWAIPSIFLVVPIAFRAATGLTASFHPEINSHFPAALDAFALGMLMSGLDCAGLLKQDAARFGIIGLVLWPLALLLCAQTHLHSPVDNASEIVSDGMAKVGSFFLLSYVANPQHPIARMLSNSYLRWCGIISYEWYLFHQPITLWGRGRFGSTGGNAFRYAGVVCGSFLLSTLVAALVYRCFSMPLLKYGRKSSPKRAHRDAKECVIK